MSRSKPLAIWLDQNSASASEVLAGALQDSCRAATVGPRSFGKGLIQGVYGLSDGGGLVLTVAKYETPRGQVIQGEGVRMDVKRSLDVYGIPGLGVGVDSVDWDGVEDVKRACVARGK